MTEARATGTTSDQVTGDANEITERVRERYIQAATHVRGWWGRMLRR